METVAVVNIFSRSMNSYGLRYLKFFGDDHFQLLRKFTVVLMLSSIIVLDTTKKRVGNRLRKLRKRVKGLSGRGKAKEVIHKTVDGKVEKLTIKLEEC